MFLKERNKNGRRDEESKVENKREGDRRAATGKGEMEKQTW